MGPCVEEWSTTVLKQLTLCSYPKETISILSRDIFLFGLQDQDFLAKYLSDGTEIGVLLTLGRLQNVGSSMAIVKNVSRMPTSQP